MNAQDLQQVRPGFDDAAQGSQQVFRRALQALAMPGRLVALPALAQLPGHGLGTAALLLLTLLDSDCTLWLSPSLAGSDAQAWLRFHTGCRVVAEPGQARFLWLGAGDAWPALAAMDAGTDHYPDASATAVMELRALRAGDAGADPAAWVLDGPGIAGTLGLHAQGLPPDFEAQWAANHAGFPRGVDLFLVDAEHIVGLPRSTRLRSLQRV